MTESFVKPWTNLLAPDEPIVIFVPSLDVALATRDNRWQKETFLVDSGADVSLAPRELCAELGLTWGSGRPISLSGISPNAECAVPARVFDVEILVPDIGVAFVIPVCFADGDVSQILGREGFFDAFRITFDKPRLTTTFELIEEP